MNAKRRSRPKGQTAEEALALPEAGSAVPEVSAPPGDELPPAWKRFLRGPGGIVCSSVAFALMNFLVKVASGDFPSGEVTFARFFFGTLSLGALGLAGRLEIRARNPRLLLTRGLLGSCAILLLFTAISKTSLTNAILLGNTYVLFGALFSLLFLGEGFGYKIGVALGAALLGAACILRPDLHQIRTGDLLALCHGVIGGGAITVVRSLRRAGHESPWAILFYLSLVGVSAGLFTGTSGWSVPYGAGLLLLLSIGVLGTLGQALLTYAYRWCTTAEGGILSLLVVPLSAALGAVFLGERMGGGEGLGAAFILLSSAWVVTDRG